MESKVKLFKSEESYPNARKTHSAQISIFYRKVIGQTLWKQKEMEIQVWKQQVFCEPSGGQGVQPTELTQFHGMNLTRKYMLLFCICTSQLALSNKMCLTMSVYK